MARTDDRQTRVLICIDDTDDLSKRTSTGHIAEAIATHALARLGARPHLAITRHQLLISELVPYTSHNSSMCSDLTIAAGQLGELHDAALRILLDMRAESSNPGLCICRLDDGFDPTALIAFGRRAKVAFIEKRSAMELADALGYVTLEIPAGNGDGIVGALAGVGLRLSGNDGRFRGKWNLMMEPSPQDDGSGETILTPMDIADRLRGRIDAPPLVLDKRSEEPLPADTPLHSSAQVKPVLVKGRFVLLADRDDEGTWHLCEKNELTDWEQARPAESRRSCPLFEFDNDDEEFRTSDPDSSTCGNCLYRRVLPEGYSCERGMLH